MSQYYVSSAGSGGTSVNSITATAPLTANGVSGTPETGAVTIALTTPLPVADGGTGDASFTAYAVITGGTTSTGALQNVSGLGSSGNVLTSNGAGALPTWQAAASGGITTIDGNSGSVTGSTVTITTGAANAQGTSVFTGSSSTLTLTYSNSHDSTGLGFDCLKNVGTAATCTGFGYQALFNITSGSSACDAFGWQALFAATNNCTNTVAIGQSSLAAYNGVGNQTAVGNSALVNLTGDATSNGQNVAVGYSAGRNLATGEFGTYIGVSAGQNYSGAESSNICIGWETEGTASESNVLRIGNATGTSAGNLNAAYIQGIYGKSPSSPQMAIINSSGQLGSQAIPSAGIGTLDGNSGSATGSTVTITTGASNTQGTAKFTGSSATVTLAFSDAAVNGGNTGLGTSVLSHLAVAGGNFGNTALGAGALATTVNCVNCTSIGFDTLTVYTGDGSTDAQIAIGAGTLKALTGPGGLGVNVAIGNFTAQNLLTGGGNFIVGSAAGNNYTGSESYNILLGYGVEGVTGDNNVLRIGTSNFGGSSITSAYIAGIAGVTISSTAAVLVDTSTNQLGTIISSRRFKDNIQNMGDASDFIYQLRPVKFTLKAHPEYGQQTGLIAEEVLKIAPQLVALDAEGIPTAVSYHELPALLLNEIQKLNKRISELEKKGIK